jgi:tetratricopeptide (TPR) repeat protein
MLTESDFNQVQQRLVSAWHIGDVAAALDEIELVLREGTPEMKAQCIFYRGMIRQSMGSSEKAKQDWLQALSYAREGTFLRYELEHCLGEAYEESEALKEALQWYRTALGTCSTGEEFSGNKTLVAFMRLSGDNISPDDKALLASVIQKSWRVLEVPGELDLTDLAASVSTLTTRFNNIVAEATADS